MNWLSSLMIHHANNERTAISTPACPCSRIHSVSASAVLVYRPKRDGLKVGGHQASCASSVSILTALYTKVLEPQDRVAVKPHAGPVFHALMYLMGRQSRDNLQRFRALGGVQPYPSRTKDLPEVDLSTGSVGLGAALTCFTRHSL